MREKQTKIDAMLALVVSLVLGVIALTSCGSTSQTSSSMNGTVQTFLSDPPTPTCADDFSSVYVTITKVQANLSSSAGPNDSSWQTLVDLSSTPTQVDLMKLNPSETPNFCGTLYMLAKQQLPPGKYQQIRLILLANNASSGPASNACTTGGFNCVVPNGSSTPVELNLSSQAQTGIKIPSSQITNGGLTVTAGQNTDLNIDFQSCESIVREGNGQYRLKPVLHAGEVSLNNSVISGKVIDSSSSDPIADATVLLEQPDPNDNTTDAVMMSGMTGSDGSFSFCPLPASNTNFDIVVAGQTTQSGATTTTTTYNPTVLFNVPIGRDVGNIPLYAETSTASTNCTTGNTCPGTISGQITTTNSGSPVAGTVQLSALQPVTGSGSTITEVTIPVFQALSQPPNFTTNSTKPTSGCATSTADCTAYSLMVPASSLATGAFSTTSISYTAPSSTSQASYTVNALADGSNGLLTCDPASTTSKPVTVMSGSAVTATDESTLNFALTGCMAP